MFISRFNVANNYDNHKMSASQLVDLQYNNRSKSIGQEFHALQI
jgi:hypothetical protein